MMIQKLFQSALKYAGEKHQDQRVPGSEANYLLHISNVAMEIIMAHKMQPDFDLEFAVQVAILHDTLEDTDTTYEELSKIFGIRIADAVRALTKDDILPTKAAQMADSLDRIKQQPKEVALVKLADRITNLQPPPSHWTKEKKGQYLKEAENIAETLGGRQEYLDERIKNEISQYQQFI